MKFIFHRILSLFLFLFCFNSIKAQTCADQYITPFSIDSMQAGFKTFFEANPELKNKKIIGLGEATHINKEFSTYKIELFKYLVKNEGYRIFIIEADFAGCRIIDDYITKEKRDVYTCLFKMSQGVWMTNEMRDFIDWMKSYNTTQANNNKIRFYGCDMLYFTENASQIKQALEAENLLNANYRSTLDWCSNFRYSVKYSDAEKDKILTGIEELKKVELKPSEDKELLELQIKLLAVSVKNFGQSKKPSANTNNIRDLYMAENVQFIYKYEKETKAVLWAHNGHVAKEWTNSKIPMGSYLKKNFGNDYYVLGAGFYKGRAMSYNFKTLKYEDLKYDTAMVKGSGDELFAKLNPPDFIFDFKNALKCPILSGMINKKASSRDVGPDFSQQAVEKHILTNTYDGFIFFREVTPRTIVSKK